MLRPLESMDVYEISGANIPQIARFHGNLHVHIPLYGIHISINNLESKALRIIKLCTYVEDSSRQISRHLLFTGFQDGRRNSRWPPFLNNISNFVSKCFL